MNQTDSTTNPFEDEVTRILEEAREKQKYDYHQQVCPNCGYCPCCGRRWGQPYQPYWPPYGVWSGTPQNSC